MLLGLLVWGSWTHSVEIIVGAAVFLYLFLLGIFLDHDSQL